jgi:hypothetical protein
MNICFLHPQVLVFFLHLNEVVYEVFLLFEELFDDTMQQMHSFIESVTSERLKQGVGFLKCCWQQ